MPFVQGKCESCGGILVVDPELKAANCPFCGTAYVVQDSINYYNTTIKVETMHADVINMSDESSSEGRLKAAEAFMRLGKFEQAEANYKMVTEMTPQNYHGWLGLIESHTQNYTKRIKSTSELKRLNEFVQSVKVFSPSGSGEVLTKQCISYINSEAEKNKNELEDFNKAIAEQQNKIKEYDEQYKSLTDSITQIRAQVDSVGKRGLFMKRITNHWQGLIISASILIPVGWVSLYVFPIFGVVLMLSGFALLGLLIYGKIGCSVTSGKLNTLQHSLSDIALQGNDIHSKKANVNRAISAIQVEIEKYN